MCLMVADMLEYVPVNKDLRLTAGTGHKLRLAYSPSMGLYLGTYLHAPKRGQVGNREDPLLVTLCVLKRGSPRSSGLLESVKALFAKLHVSGVVSEMMVVLCKHVN